MDELTPIERIWAEGMQGCTHGECLEAETLLELAERGRKAADYSVRMAHVAVCPVCRETLKMLSATELARPRMQFALAWPTARYLVAAGLAVTVLAVWLSMPKGAGTVKSGADVAARPPVHENPALERPKPLRGVVAEKHGSVAPPILQRPHRHGGSLAMRVRRHRPHSPGVTRFAPGHLNDEASGTLEGSVGETETLQGEVRACDGIIEGEVLRKIPPSS